MLGLGQGETDASRPEFSRSGSTPVVSAVAAPVADDSFHSAYRLAGDELVILDQRGIPEKLDEVIAKRGSDVAYYLRLGVARGGPVIKGPQHGIMPELCAYASGHILWMFMG